MVKQPQIKFYLIKVFFFITINISFSQTKKIELIINDTIKASHEVTSQKNISIKIDSINITELKFYPNSSIRNVLIKQNENKFLKLGFNYVGILISSGEYKLVGDTITADGLHYHYTEDGILSHIYSYKNGVLNGIYKSYYLNGMLEQFGNYVNGQKKGKWIRYSEKGLVVKVENLE